MLYLKNEIFYDSINQQILVNAKKQIDMHMIKFTQY